MARKLRALFIILGAIVALALVLVAIQQVLDQKSSTNSSPNVSSQEKAVSSPKIQEIGFKQKFTATEPWDYTAMHVMDAVCATGPTSDDIVCPPAGQKIMDVTIQVSNRGSTTAYPPFMNQIALPVLEDSSGQRHELIDARKNGQLGDNTVQPNTTQEFLLYYWVPETEKVPDTQNPSSVEYVIFFGDNGVFRVKLG